MKEIEPNTAQGYLEQYEPTNEEVLNMLPIFMCHKQSKTQIKKLIAFAKSFLIEKNKKKND